jgi:hypothetical protein
MKIDSTGDGLNILIACDSLLHHNWMSFFCWYSISKNLPDAKVFLTCNRKIKYEDLFVWTRKCNVPFCYNKESDLDGQIKYALDSFVSRPLLVVPPDCVCVRDFNEAGFSLEGLTEINKLDNKISCDCKDERPCCFVTYSQGWGKFVTSKWINKIGSPFFSSSRFDKGILTSNEIKIGHLWNSAVFLFQNVSR